MSITATTGWDHSDHDPLSTTTDPAETTHASDDFYTDWHAEVDQHRIALLTTLNNALRTLDDARTALAELTSNHVYDIEFVESRPGADVAAFLDDSLRYLRAAYTITRDITERG